VIRITRPALLWLTFAAALAVFAVVQDRVTAAGARAYVQQQREALAGHGRPVGIDDVMRPVVARSLRLGLLWGGTVLIVGLGATVALAPPRLREGSRPGDARE
jgi:hypothetical protein